MMDSKRIIKTPDYEGVGRRQKVKLTISEIIKIGSYIVLAIAGAATLIGTVKGLAKETDKNCIDIETLKKDNAKQDNADKVMQNDIKHIIAKQEKFEQVQMVQTQLLYQIKGKLNNGD